MGRIPTQTLNRFILAEERQHEGASGELSDLLASIGLGVKLISRAVTTAAFAGMHGYTDKENVQGEIVHQLDEEADDILIEILSSSGHFGSVVSEERDEVVASEVGHDTARYVVAFDPLDGSSNIGSNIPVGTIFAVFRKTDDGRSAGLDDYLQPAKNLVAAGYSVYGAMTSFVYTSGSGVHGFTFDPGIGEFILTERDIRVPESGSIYSVNEGYQSLWDAKTRSSVEEF
jgi:fructose-1,6-bisphosphatase I